MNTNQLVVGISVSLGKGENGRIWELCFLHIVFLLPAFGLPLSHCPCVPHLLPLVSPTALCVWLMVLSLGLEFHSLYLLCLPSLGARGSFALWCFWYLEPQGALVDCSACRRGALVFSPCRTQKQCGASSVTNSNTWREGARLWGLDWISSKSTKDGPKTPSPFNLSIPWTACLVVEVRMTQRNWAPLLVKLDYKFAFIFIIFAFPCSHLQRTQMDFQCRSKWILFSVPKPEVV